MIVLQDTDSSCGGCKKAFEQIFRLHRAVVSAEFDSVHEQDAASLSRNMTQRGICSRVADVKVVWDRLKACKLGEIIRASCSFGGSSQRRRLQQRSSSFKQITLIRTKKLGLAYRSFFQIPGKWTTFSEHREGYVNKHIFRSITIFLQDVDLAADVLRLQQCSKHIQHPKITLTVRPLLYTDEKRDRLHWCVRYIKDIQVQLNEKFVARQE